MSKCYWAWSRIKQRCYNPKHGKYPNYGGRGIKVCDRWLDSFENFLIDMGEPPSSKHSIDRISSNGDYEPLNCRWATVYEQNINKRNSIIITLNGETKTLVEWSLETGFNYRTLLKRLANGWDINKIFITPPDQRLNTRGIK